MFFKAGAGVATLAAGSAWATEAGFPGSMLIPGVPPSGYGTVAPSETQVQRIVSVAEPGLAPGAGASRTPLGKLQGMITPNGLHYERHHNGVPKIDPGQHRLLIHGLVNRPLFFTVEALHRYPMVSRMAFIECAGNSAVNAGSQAKPLSAGAIHGLVSCVEWTGVALSLLLQEAGLQPGGKWLLAEGADAAGMSRSVPLVKAMDDAMIALYQNGEAVRPEQGYPMRLLLPGWEGNMNVKWLRRLKVTPGPTYTKDETSKYTALLANGYASQFNFVMETKSVITHPSGGMKMQGPGFYEISGLAWSGNGRIVKVDVSADTGATWALASLSEPVLPKALTRFRIPWTWDGQPVVLQSRATDEKGSVQPTRSIWKARYHSVQSYHMNGIQSWMIGADGETTNVFA